MNLPKSPGSVDRRVIAIDLGAESCRVSLVECRSHAGQIITVHRFSNGPVERDGHLCWDLRRIHEQLQLGLRKCAEQADGAVDAIGVDGWAVDYVRIGPDGQPLQAPFCYRDSRTVGCPEEFWKTLHAERLYEITGIQMLRFNTVYQLICDRQSGLDPGTGWLNLPEYVLHDLGGERVAEYTNATHTQLLSAAERAWSNEIFAVARLDQSKASRIVPPGTIVGTLRGALAALPHFKNTRLIAPACHDTGSAVAGIPAHGDDWAFISSGTWSLVGTVLDRPCVSPAAFSNNLSNEGGLGGKIRFLKNVNGMWLIEECLRHWREAGADWTAESLVEACRSQNRPTELLNVDDAELMLAGEMPQRINRVLQRQEFTPYPESPDTAPRLANLIFHSLAERYVQVLNTIREVTDKHFSKIYVVGGGSRNSYLNGLLQQRSGLEVIRGPVESSTIGNAAIQLAVLDGAKGQFGVSSERVAEWSDWLSKLSAD
jgi:rhamnulokinase